MKNLVFILIILISCNSKNESVQKPEKETKSRIKNEDLRHFIPELIKIYELTFKGNPYFENYNAPKFIKFLTTKENVYVHISSVDCTSTSFYSFVEKIDSNEIQILVESNSFQPERYFDLNMLKLIPVKGPMICEDWYFVGVKFHADRGKLILEKVSTFFDDTYKEDFYDESDSTFLTEIGILIPEPKPFE